MDVVLRSVVCAYVTCWGSWVAADQPATSVGESSNGRVKIVLIGTQPDHPPGTHLYLEECESLAKCLRDNPRVEAVVSNGWPTDPSVLEGVSAIVLYSSPGAEILLKGPQHEQFEKMMKRGVGLVALHWATGVLDKDDKELSDRYLSYLGGLFSFAFSGLEFATARIEQIEKEHPICRGWGELELHDEYYLDLKFLPEAKALLRVQLRGKPQTVAWVYERPDSNGGRSYGNTMGHFHELFLQEPFRRTLVNGILWAAKLEVPADGAPCAAK